MGKSIDRVVTALAGAAIAVGVIKGPQISSQIYQELTKPAPVQSGVVTAVEAYETTFGFGTRQGREYIEYKIQTDNGEVVLAANRGVQLAQQGEYIEFRLGGSIGSWPHES